ncbi:hypothetical protein [Idiomarina xiamenensis]|uniref:Uncharacterized protein n=1 Tax=Idiomarina xiamenensis 10-D-4 TaxID=740709 RepID=K2JWM7_9GAMM|nr:hypothetical protein [Idiomarina xiamenensis]EKE79913.1 hypothetical protein A10D4_12438 [Idiomarina xiamenensis 10-D-4]
MKSSNKFLLITGLLIGGFSFLKIFFPLRVDDSVWAVKTVDKKVQQLSETDKKLVQQQSIVVTKTITDGSVDASNSQQVANLNIYESLTYQEILTRLAKSASRDEIDISAVLLALIENGTLDVNTPMRQGAQSSHYTPLYVALVLDDDITTEQIQSFIKMGAYIEANSMWTRQLAKLQDVVAAELLIDAAGYGPEQTEELLQAVFQQANVNLFNRLVEKGDFIIDSNFSEKLFSDSMMAIEYEADYNRLTIASTGNAKVDSKLNTLRQYRIQTRIAQLQLLKQNLQLSVDHRQSLDSQLIALEDLLESGGFERTDLDTE